MEQFAGSLNKSTSPARAEMREQKCRCIAFVNLDLVILILTSSSGIPGCRRALHDRALHFLWPML